MRPPRSLLATALLVPLLGALAGPAGAQFEVLLKVGDPAPGFGAGYTVASFVEPPSMADLRVLLLVGVDGPGSDDPMAIYHWSRSGGLTRVAYTGQTVFFIGGLSRTLTFLESPITDGSTIERSVAATTRPGSARRSATIAVTILVRLAGGSCRWASFS